ncbi:hypothetical protein BpHYR1_035987 [Brachionus plicatilis]|uniref:Uncharacterized protein n=1 Tax=Brachionus plicatilis TaxID=10195 RepID=A0A3M7QQE4_BRAPC|nr:hypothetical protein BpHYR1_035987 [Brachionus plicatilis]
MNLKCDFCFNTASYPVTLDCCLFTTCYEHFDKWVQCGICQTHIDHQQTLSKLKNKISHNLDQFKRQHDSFRILLGENKRLKHDPGYFISKNKISNPMLQNWLFSEMDSVQLDPIETKTNEFIFDTLTLSQTISDKLQLAEMIQRRLEILTDINKNFKLETKLLQNIEELEAKPKPTLAQSRKTDVPMASLRLTAHKVDCSGILFIERINPGPYCREKLNNDLSFKLRIFRHIIETSSHVLAVGIVAKFFEGTSVRSCCDKQPCLLFLFGKGSVRSSEGCVVDMT